MTEETETEMDAALWDGRGIVNTPDGPVIADEEW